METCTQHLGGFQLSDGEGTATRQNLNPNLEGDAGGRTAIVHHNRVTPRSTQQKAKNKSLFSFYICNALHPFQLITAI